jgi:hypothetical protein
VLTTTRRSAAEQVSAVSKIVSRTDLRVAGLATIALLCTALVIVLVIVVLILVALLTLLGPLVIVTILLLLAALVLTVVVRSAVLLATDASARPGATHDSS